MTIKNLYPTARPVLDLNFANTKELDPRITFTRATTGTYVDKSGIVRHAAVNEPRFDHSGTGESLGLLVEEARTNLARNSKNLSPWTLFGAPIVTLNATTAPDGTTTATKFTKSKPQKENFYTGVGTGAQSRSFFAKAGTSSFVFLEDGAPFCWFDLSNGTVPVNPNGSGSIVALSNGWYRCTVSKNFGSSNFALGISDTSNSDNAATGNYAYFWGAQAEASSYPTSYIPTTTAAVTRAADLVSMTGANFSSWYNNREGTFFTDAILGYTINAGSPFTFGGVIYATNSGTLRTLGNQQIASGLPISLANFSKVAVALKSGNFAVGVGGSIQNASKLAYTPTGTEFSINSSLGSKALIKRLAYYDRRLTDIELKAITL